MVDNDCLGTLLRELRVQNRRHPMSCKLCGRENGRAFNGEVAIHFPGRDGLNKPIVWVFPELSVCLRCGFAAFMVPEREMNVLTNGKAVEGSVIFLDA
jgi:hypothetical protein